MRGMPLVQACMSKGSYCSGEKADKSMNFNTEIRERRSLIMNLTATIRKALKGKNRLLWPIPGRRYFIMRGPDHPVRKE